MLVYGEAVQEVVAAVRARRNARIVGRRLGGRTTVLRAAIESLESSGTTVLQMSGDQLSGEHPGYALQQLRDALSLGPRQRELSGVVDSLSSALSARDVIAVDDVHLVDSLSLRALSVLRKRVGVVVVSTELVGHAHDLDFPPVWPEAVIPIPDLDLASSALLLESALGHPVESRTHLQIYGKAGGNAGLTIALAESAQYAGLIELDGSHWRGDGRRLWNNHLAPLVDGLLAELAPEERELVSWLAAEGPVLHDRVVERFSEPLLRRVFDLHYAAPVGARASLLVQVWPPLLVNRVRQHAYVGTFPEEGLSDNGTPVLSEVPGNELALLARSFVEHEERATRATFRTWTVAPTPANALAYLAAAMGVSSEAERVRRVFSQTTMSHRLGDQRIHQAFAMRRLQWLRFDEHDGESERAMLAQLLELNPGMETSLNAALASLDIADGRGVPEDIARLETPPNDEWELVGRIACALSLGDVDGVRRGVESATHLAGHGVFIGFVETAQLYLEGEVRESVRRALEQRELARERFSRSEYTMLSYVAAVGALYLGDIQLMRQYVDEGTVAGQPSSSLNIFYGALFALEAGLAHYSGQTRLRDNLQREAATRLPSIGPGIGMGADFLDATIRLSDQPEEFASAVEATVDRSLELGYRLGAVQTAALSLTIRWNDRIAEAFLRAFTIAAIPAYVSTAEGVRLIAQRDLPGLDAWGATLSPDRDDAEMLVRVLGAAYRSARREELPLAEVLERILSTVLQRRTETIATGEIAQLLSSRELQVGRLGGELSNTEIAERLSISRRTVENHIANGLKKTGLANRKELARLLQSL